MKIFTASNFRGECLCDEDFVDELELMNTVAIKHNIIVIITSSFRKDTNVGGAIVTPAKLSNHLVGHAIDCNLQDAHTKEYFNSKKMADGKGADQLFVEDVVKNTGLRWGEAFNVPDSVHFDDSLNLKNPELWKQKYLAIHPMAISDNASIQQPHL